MINVTALRYAGAAVIVAVAGVTFAATAPISDTPSAAPATPPAKVAKGEARNANVLNSQDFQDKHDNALDPNDKSKPAKAKKVKRHLAKSDTVKTMPESAKTPQ